MDEFVIGERLDIEFKPARYPYNKVPLYCSGDVSNIKNGVVELDNCSVGRIISMKLYPSDSKVQIMTLNEENTEKQFKVYDMINIKHI